MQVSDLFGHIQKDPRHKDVALLHYEEIFERRFGGWTMGQVNLSKLNHSILLKYSEKPSSTRTPSPARSRCAARRPDGHRRHLRPGSEPLLRGRPEACRRVRPGGWRSSSSPD
jgi:hypothetical protein